MAKNIYRFKVSKQEKKQVEVERENKETGEKETVLQNKTVKTPIQFLVKKPSRKMTDDAEVHYAVELSKAIKQGIVTKAMLTKKYADNGGALSEDESKEMLRAVKKSQDLNNEYQMLESSGGNKERQEEIEKELLEIRQEMIDLENAVQSVYQHTADARAERSLIMWYVTQLTKYLDESGEELDFFEGIDSDDKIEDFYNKDESDSDFDQEVLDKSMKAISYWFYTKSTDEKEIEKFVNQKDES